MENITFLYSFFFIKIVWPITWQIKIIFYFFSMNYKKLNAIAENPKKGWN